jgi:hypothetical protein
MKRPRKLSSLVPTSWLDELLSGEGVPRLPWGCPEIERLLSGVRKRIEAAEMSGAKGKEGSRG